MRTALIGFAAGTFCLQTQATLAPQATLGALVLVAMLLALLAAMGRASRRAVCCALVSGVLSGFCWAGFAAQAALAHQLLRADEGRDVTLVGTIDSLPYRFEGGVRFNFAVEETSAALGAIPPRVALAWYAAGRGGRAREVHPGERWQLTVRLQRPHGNANPHGFDYEVWLLEQGVRATGYVRNEASTNRRLDRFVPGFRNSVERARAGLRGRITSVSHVLCAALGLVVLLDPWATLAPGFWLSFGAVAAILYASVGRIGRTGPGWHNALLTAARTQYAVTIALVPLTMLLFAQVSLVSPIANAIAIPLVSFVVTPLALAGSMLPAPLSPLLLQLAHAVIAALATLLGWLAQLPSAVWTAPAPVPWVFAFALFGTIWLLAPRGWPLRWLGLVAWIPLLSAQPSSPAPGQIAVTAFDVGQGMALLIETSGHRLLYDTGPAYSPESNGANRVILPYLRARGIARLDGVIVSHSDVDHAGGALSLLDAVAVGWVWSSLWPDHPIVGKAPRHGRCVAGQSWEWDGVRFEMLQPGTASYDNAALKPNARGCTLKVSTAAHSLLLAADIEAAQESELVVRQRHKLDADVLLAPHHGSGTSSTPAFLAAVSPALAIFQVGYRNRYRHPKEEVVERYRDMGIARLRTDEEGAIMFGSADGFVPRRYRHEHLRYWYGQ